MVIDIIIIIIKFHTFSLVITFISSCLCLGCGSSGCGCLAVAVLAVASGVA